MKRNLVSKKIIIIIGILFFCFSNVYILIKAPLIYTGGCNDNEYESILFIKENLPSPSYVFTDLRLGSIIRTVTENIVFDAPGYQLSTYQEINVTFQVFYSNDSFKAYYCLSNFFIDLKMGVKEFYVLFSRSYVSEGFSTMDFSFGPIPPEAYSKYLNSTFFEIVFKNEGSFIVKAKI